MGATWLKHLVLARGRFLTKADIGQAPPERVAEIESVAVGCPLHETSAVTGEGLALMAVRGQGEVWLAHEAANCFILDLTPGDGITLNGRNVLCFGTAAVDGAQQ